MVKILILSGSAIDKKVTQSGLRCLEFAGSLCGELEVTLAAPNESDSSYDGFEFVRYKRDNPQSIIDLIYDNDIILFCGMDTASYHFLKELDKPIIFDISAQSYIEPLVSLKGQMDIDTRKEREAAAKRVASQLQLGDFFICASERQRDYWLGMLSVFDRIKPDIYEEDNTLRNLIDVISYGVGSPPPRHSGNALKGTYKSIRKDDFLLIWEGALWDQMDPSTVIRALYEISKKRDDIKLLFMGSVHESGHIAPMKQNIKAMQLAKELKLLNKCVYFYDGKLSCDKRADFLTEADCGISAHIDHIKTQHTINTGLIDYLWAALPVITTKGGLAADLIAKEGAGVVLGAEDINGWRDAILEMADSAEALKGHKAGAKRAAKTLSWGKICAPLLRFCKSPVKRVKVEAKIIDYENIIRLMLQELSEKKATMNKLINNRFAEMEHHYNVLNGKLHEMREMVDDHSSFVHKVRNTLPYRLLRKLKSVIR